MISDICDLKGAIDALADERTTEITISGGEPSMHPNFIELLEYMQKKHINFTILTNAEMFSNTCFLDSFLRSVKTSSVKIITTLHSHLPFEHEQANRTKGSFERTLNGLMKLSANGIRIIIKHCITRSNYMQLVDFYKFCDTTFDNSVDIQLSSIDYCGIPKNKLNDERLLFTEIKPFLETLFDYHKRQSYSRKQRRLYGINIPLCACDVIYWSYLPHRNEKMYDFYKDPHNAKLKPGSNNVGISSIYCEGCKISSLCNGTYYSGFDLFGSELVLPFK